MNSLKKELVSVRIPIELNKKFTNHVSALGISKTAFFLGLLHKELKNEQLEEKNSDRAKES